MLRKREVGKMEEIVVGTNSYENVVIYMNKLYIL